MSRAWMPLYIADFLADTMHLDNSAIGAYLLLIMHYWQHGELSNDSKVRRLIARSPVRSWSRIENDLKPFFSDGWKHKRIDQELEKYRDISKKRSAIASDRWCKTNAIAEANGYANEYANPRACAGASQPHINKDSLIGGAENLNGAVAKTTEFTKTRSPCIFNETGTEQWNAWEKHWRALATEARDFEMPQVRHWETKKMGWYFPTEYPPQTPTDA